MTSRPRRQPHAPRRAQAAQARVTVLRAAGGTYRDIATAAGLAPMTVHSLAAGDHRPAPATIRAILGVTPGTLAPGRADAGGTRLRLRALHVMGHGCARIARAAGASPQVIRAITRGDTSIVPAALRDTITAVYDAWWDKQAPGRTPAEKTAATRARRRAITGNWCPAAALDDDDLDTPSYRPAYGWKAATGTGTATDYPLTLAFSKENRP
jgi:lambda repressor-like predicted transcriptional regulator